MSKETELAAELGSNLAEKSPAIGMPKTIRIILEENDDIPPRGLYVGHNGKGYLLPAGVEMDCPVGVVGILNDAIKMVAVVDPLTKRVGEARPRRRFPYRVIERTAA